MKKLLGFTLILGFLLGSASCIKKSSDDPGQYLAGTIHGLPDGNVDYTLKLVVPGGGSSNPEVLASATVHSSGTKAKFKISLPDMSSYENLAPINNGGIPAWVTVTNNVGTVSVLLHLYDGNDNKVGEIANAKQQQTGQTQQSAIGGLGYYDGATKIYGQNTEGADTTTMDVDAKKGWNWSYIIATITPESRTTLQTSVNPGGLQFMLI